MDSIAYWNDVETELTDPEDDDGFGCDPDKVRELINKFRTSPSNMAEYLYTNAKELNV